MPKVWLAIPSAREEKDSTVPRWFSLGYGIALWRDGSGPIFELNPRRILIQHPVYPGYAVAVNRLVQMVFEYDEYADYVVIAGDDVMPDGSHWPDKIADSITAHFGGTFGVCQPVGDTWGDKNGPYIKRVAGSAWYGREYCRRINQGNGPLWPEYHHMFVDQEAREVAIRHGAYWERPDLTHFHQHWARPKPGERIGLQSRMPVWLERANSAAEWLKYKAIFAARQAAGFPGSDLL